MTAAEQDRRSTLLAFAAVTTLFFAWGFITSNNDPLIVALRAAFSLNYTEADFAAVADRFVAAAEAMQREGWWCSDPALTNRSIKRTILKEMIAHRFLS